MCRDGAWDAEQQRNEDHRNECRIALAKANRARGVLLFQRMAKAIVQPGPVALINKRKMAPGVPGIEGSTMGHDVVKVQTAIGYFVDRVWVTEGMRPGILACRTLQRVDEP